MSRKIPISQIPELMEIWDWDRNTILPDSIGKRCDKKVWWCCPNGHDSYLQSPHQKVSGSTDCPRCNIEKRARDVAAEWREKRGSIAKTHPELIAEWDYQKNTVAPEEIMGGSHTKIWWICLKCHNSFCMTPNLRTAKGCSCPVCGATSRAKTKRENLKAKYGSLAESHPLLASEWDYEKNIDTPSDVHQGTPDRRWWICTMGHPSYQQSIRDRVRRNYGCPKCQGELHTSFPEQVVFFYIHRLFPDTINRYKEKGYEIDIYIPSLRIGIEYDGLYWHQNKKQRENEKDNYFYQHDIRIIHIKEYDHKWPEGEFDNNIIWVCRSSNYNYLKSTLSQLGDILGCCIDDIDICRDAQRIWKEYLSFKTKNSLLTKFPGIAAEWDYERNSITPDVVTPHSGKKVHWICPNCGNRYEMVVSDRTDKKHCGCPQCGSVKRNQHQRLVQEKNIQTITNYRKENPEVTIAECAKAIGLSYPTVKKYWGM